MVRFWFITFLFCFNGAFAAPNCQELKSLTQDYKLCWNDTHKGWFSENCRDGKCEAISFLKVAKTSKPKTVSDSRNPSVQLCHDQNLKIEILRDDLGNEQSYCVFADKSLVDSNTIDLVTP